jgi:putative addiction module component (TIGR02574 family)
MPENATELIPDAERILQEALRLDGDQRTLLAGRILESVADDGPPLSAAQRAELDRRLADFRKNPDQGSPWEVVRERLRAGIKNR